MGPIFALTVADNLRSLRFGVSLCRDKKSLPACGSIWSFSELKSSRGQKLRKVLIDLARRTPGN